MKLEPFFVFTTFTSENSRIGGQCWWCWWGPVDIIINTVDHLGQLGLAGGWTITRGYSREMNKINRLLQYGHRSMCNTDIDNILRSAFTLHWQTVLRIFSNQTACQWRWVYANCPLISVFFNYCLYQLSMNISIWKLKDTKGPAAAHKLIQDVASLGHHCFINVGHRAC